MKACSLFLLRVGISVSPTVIELACTNAGLETLRITQIDLMSRQDANRLAWDKNRFPPSGLKRRQKENLFLLVPRRFIFIQGIGAGIER